METAKPLEIRHALRQLGINPAKAAEFLTCLGIGQDIVQMKNQHESALTDDQVSGTRDMER